MAPSLSSRYLTLVDLALDLATDSKLLLGIRLQSCASRYGPCLGSGQDGGQNREEYADGKPTSFDTGSRGRGRRSARGRLAQSARPCRSPSTWHAASNRTSDRYKSEL